MDNNFHKYFGDPEKVATCIIEHDIEEEMVRGVDECLRVYTTYRGTYEELGTFNGSWEFEEWLLSDLPYQEWKAKRADQIPPQTEDQ